MSAHDSVAVIGLGLIGGSLARDLAAKGATVLGFDLDPVTVRKASEAGVVRIPLGRGLEGVEEARWVVVATPVDATPGVLAALRPRLRDATLVTDVGSTKRSAVRAAHELGLDEVFVGSHPLAGGVASGWEAAREGLFAGARVYLCPAQGASAFAAGEAEALWVRCGARPERLTAEEHDRRLAWTSHLPQLLSTALAVVLRDIGVGPSELGPGGRDVTRLAASSARMWEGIAAENADVLAPALAVLEARLAATRAALLRGDRAAARAFFEAGAAWAAGAAPAEAAGHAHPPLA